MKERRPVAKRKPRSKVGAVVAQLASGGAVAADALASVAETAIHEATVAAGKVLQKAELPAKHAYTALVTRHKAKGAAGVFGGIGLILLGLVLAGGAVGLFLLASSYWGVVPIDCRCHPCVVFGIMGGVILSIAACVSVGSAFAYIIDALPDYKAPEAPVIRELLDRFLPRR